MAAWITQRAGMSPAVVSTASPSPIGAFWCDSSCTAGPPAREIAPATPPPCSSRVFAALAMASTSSAVMSVSSTSIRAMHGYGIDVADERIRVRAHGRVQGVFFRDSVRREAARRGVAGWARNCADGTAEAVFEGPAGRGRRDGRVRAPRARGTPRSTASRRRASRPRACPASASARHELRACREAGSTARDARGAFTGTSGAAKAPRPRPRGRLPASFTQRS